MPLRPHTRVGLIIGVILCSLSATTNAVAKPGQPGPQAQRSGLAQAASQRARYAKGQLIVKYQESVTECVHCVLKSRKSFRAATADASHSLDRLHAKYGVTSARALLRSEQEEAKLAGPPTLALLKRYHTEQREAMQHRFSRRQQRAPASASIPDVTHLYLVDLPASADVEAAAAEFRRDPHVAYAQPNLVFEPDATPNDPQFADQYAHVKTHAAPAWDRRWDASAIRVAVIGQGIDIRHPDLAANVWINPCEDLNQNGQVDLSDFNGVDDACPGEAPNGKIDDLRGWDFAGGDNDPSPNAPQEYHETAVAGVIGAVGNNGLGLAGVCWKAQIMPLRINYATDQVVQALQYAYANGADVVNMSFGSYDLAKYGPNSALKDLIMTGVANGVLLVATAGNASISTKRYPGAFDEVLGVASTDSADQRSSFSNWGSWVDVAAPGTDILSTIPGGGFALVSGTSFAAPYVSGLGALLLAEQPSFDLATLRAVIEYTADKLAADRFIGSGRVNARRAIESPGIPALFAVIKSPLTGAVVNPDQTPGLPITGTALGEHFLVEYRAEADGAWHPIGSGLSLINGTLALLDAASLADGFYQIRLTATASSSQESDTVRFSVTRLYHDQAGWPKSLPEMLLTSPTVADLDGDGNGEIIVGDLAGWVHVYRADGTVFPGWPRQASNLFAFGAPAVGDVDGDGKPDVVAGMLGLGSGSAERIFAWKRNGTPLASWIVDDRVYESLALADLNGDGRDEIIAAETHNGRIHAFTYLSAVDHRSELSGWPAKLNTTWIRGGPCVGDVDGDGQLEVAVGSPIGSDGQLFLLDRTGQLRPGWPVIGGSLFNCAMGDLDGDGRLEVISAGSTDRLYVYRDNGTLYPGWPSEPVVRGGLAYSSASVADLDLDGRPEILVGEGRFSNGDGRSVYVWQSDGQFFPGWPQQAGGKVGGPPAVGDLDGDGLPDVVVSTASGAIDAWNGRGEPLNGFPIQTTGAIDLTPTLADIDGDGDVELLAANEATDLYVWDFKVAYTAHTMQWPSFRHDVNNTARYVKRNRPPILPAVEDQTVAEGQLCDVTLSASDPDGDPLTCTASGLPAWSQVDAAPPCTLRGTPGFDEASRAQPITPYPGITITACDPVRACATSAPFTLTVANVNREPILPVIGPQTVSEGQPLSFTVTATDPDGDAVTYAASSLPAGAAIDAASGVFAWMPGFDQAGSYTIIVTASDGEMADTEPITITVTNVNRPPAVGLINPASGSAKAGTKVNFTATYTDPDGWQDLQRVFFLVNTRASDANAADVSYVPKTNLLFLRNNEGTAWVGSCAPGTPQVLKNAAVKLNCAKTQVAGSGTTLTVTWTLTFKPAFLGVTKTYLKAKDASTATGWIKKGTWTITR
ncbi:MAG: S8 family serine peptidase [Candidatus Omnitrophica bacterium]|nr:S8 family serine peptidase [Candidatus Omnitrophota bacterium]